MVGYFAFRTQWGCLLLSTSELLDDNVRVRIDVLLDMYVFTFVSFCCLMLCMFTNANDF